MLGTGLTAYNETSEAAIKSAIKASAPGSGTNVHSGLRKAESLLSADTEVDDSDKYVVLLTDGKSYIWDNEKGEPISMYAQWAKEESKGVQNDGKPQLDQTAGSYAREASSTAHRFIHHGGEEIGPYSYRNFSKNDSHKNGDYYQWLYDMDSEELKSKTKYDFSCYYTGYYAPVTAGVFLDGTATKTDRSGIQNSESTCTNAGLYPYYRDYYEFTLSDDEKWQGVNWLQINPYKLKQDETGKNFDTSMLNEDFFLLHPDVMQKGTYKAGHYWKDVICKKYHTAAICLETEPPKLGSGMHIATSFAHWLEDTADYGASNKDIDGVLDIFSNIKNEICYQIERGTLTDIIPSYFELKRAAGKCPFNITLGGNVLKTSPAGDNKWNVGDLFEDEGEYKYPYQISYDTETKTITLLINTPIRNVDPMTFSYTLILDENAEEGDYETNTSANLHYFSGGSEEGNNYVFDVPVVHYSKTNIKPGPSPEPPDPSQPTEEKTFGIFPNTGDNANLTLWFTLFILGLGMMLIPKLLTRSLCKKSKRP